MTQILKLSPAAATSERAAVGEEVIHHPPGTLLRRPNIATITGVR